MNSTPSRCDQEVRRAVSIDVPHGYGVKAECVSWSSTGEGLHQMPVFAGVQISPPATHGGATILPRPYDKIGVTISIDVSGD